MKYIKLLNNNLFRYNTPIINYLITNHQSLYIWHVEVVVQPVEHQAVVKVKVAVQAEAATE